MVFEFYMDDLKQWRWRLVTKDGLVVACSADGYKTLGKVGTSMKRLMRELKKPINARTIFPSQERGYDQKEAQG